MDCVSEISTRRRRLQSPCQPQERDQRLRVLAFVDRVVEFAERPGNDLDPLVLLGLSLRCLRELRGQVQPYALIAEAWARVEDLDLLPVGGLFADLLGELAFRGVQRRFSLDVELAGRDRERGVV